MDQNNLVLSHIETVGTRKDGMTQKTIFFLYAGFPDAKPGLTLAITFFDKLLSVVYLTMAQLGGPRIALKDDI